MTVESERSLVCRQGGLPVVHKTMIMYLGTASQPKEALLCHELYNSASDQQATKKRGGLLFVPCI